MSALRTTSPSASAPLAPARALPLVATGATVAALAAVSAAACVLMIGLGL